jgi:CBS domain-containing protein
MEDKNLTLNLLANDRKGEVARIAVGGTTGLTRDGSATLSVDCQTVGSLETEVERLKSELDGALLALRKHWGEAGIPEAPAAESAEATAPERDRPTLHAELTVGDVMTRDVKTVDRNDMLSVADDLMTAGRFRHIVVVQEDGRLEGVVSQRDLFYGALAWSLGQGSEARRRHLESLPVKQVMTTHPAIVEPETPLATAAAKMIEHKVGCLPVVVRERVVGILTEGDFLALLS